MTAQLTLITGPARSGKSERLLGGYRAALREGPPGVGLWLAPTWRAAAATRAALLRGLPDGCLAPGVMTFAKFAEAVLQVAPAVIRPLSRLMKRQLVRQLLAAQHEAGRLGHFAPIADTSGFVDQLCEWIGELKRLEIWPEQFLRACEARGLEPKDRELFELYDVYQQQLREHNLYDTEGRFWSARELLKRGQRRPFERLRLVVADGFTDFTRTQHEILEILAGRVEEIQVTLPLEGEPRRDDLFTKPLATLAELKRRHARVRVEELSRPRNAAWPAMDHLERSLFRNPREAQPARETTGIEILAAARELGEIEAVARRIKRLLTEGDATDSKDGPRPVRPGEIAVVFRSPQDAGSLVGEVFARFGIPFALEMGQTLDQSPALKALVGLMRLDVEDWPFLTLLGVLSSNYFRPAWPEWRGGRTAAAAVRALSQLQIPRGREEILGALSVVAGLPTGPRGPNEGLNGPGDLRSPDRRGQETRAEQVAAVLGRLAGVLDRLPERETPTGWAAAWERLATETGLLGAMDRPGVGEGAESPGIADRVAWARLVEALQAADRLAAWMDRRPPVLDRREALAALLDILASERVGSSGDESGRVRVLSAASVRGLRIPYVFLAGLSEKAFPPPDRDDRLYSEAEYLRLIDEGLPLVARTERNREEMLLFYEALTRATRRLVLSYPAWDESAQPLLPSPYLHAVEQACGPARIRRTDLTDLTPIPTGEDPLTPAEFRVASLAEALEGDVSLLAGLVQSEPASGVGANVLAGLETTRLRSDHERFGPAEGVFEGQPARRLLAERFSAEQTLSPTMLEGYASCPFRFFIERVLKIEPLEELALAVDYMERGRLAHDVMAALHRRVHEALGRPGSPVELDAAQYEPMLTAALDEVLPPRAAEGVRGAMVEVDRRLLRSWLADYRRQHEKYDALFEACDEPPVPELFEVSFGRPGCGEAPSTEEPFVLETETDTVRISGRVDRVDVGRVAGTTVFNVIDYKTGSPLRFTEETIRAGTTLQLPLYALAVAEVLLPGRNPVPWTVGYWYLRDRGFKPDKCGQLYERSDAGVEPSKLWEQIRMELAGIVTRLVGGIRRGEFPVSSQDERCTSFCPFSTICRIGQVRALEKTWSP